MNNSLRINSHIDLFSGIGGFALAAHWAGFITEVFCEREVFCQRVLRHHWPAVPIISDIREFDGRAYRGAELLTGGFPCQPFSTAGKRGGATDDRFLWPEMLRVISEARPHWVVAENVPGIISMALDDVLSDLENEGYEVGTVIVPACGVNAPHRRDRVWIVAHTCRDEYQRKNRGWNDQTNGVSEIHRKDNDASRWISGASSIRESCSSNVSDSNITRLEGRNGESVCQCPDKQFIGSCSPHSSINSANRSRRISKSDLGERDDGLPGRLAGYWDGDWERGIPRVCGKVHDRAAKLKALGNAIVPQVAYEIINHLKYIECGVHNNDC